MEQRMEQREGIQWRSNECNPRYLDSKLALLDPLGRLRIDLGNRCSIHLSYGGP